MEAVISPGMIAFEGFRFDVDLRRLLRPDATGVWAPAAVGVRALDVLAVLLRQPGALVTKDVIMQQVWPGIAVEANNLTVQITALRKVLDGDRRSESCIQTVAGRGYRFVASVTRPSDRKSGELPEQLSDTRSCQSGSAMPAGVWQISVSRSGLGRSRRARPRRSSLRHYPIEEHLPRLAGGTKRKPPGGTSRPSAGSSPSWLAKWPVWRRSRAGSISKTCAR